MSESVVRWLRGRMPPPPSALLEWLTPRQPEAVATPEALVAEALPRLEQAARLPDRDRTAAFNLLAADALVTYACESAAEAPDPVEEMVRIIDLVTPSLS